MTTKMSFFFNLSCNIIIKIGFGGYKMIKQYRQAKNLSQEELAEEIGISWRQLQRLEYNEENIRISTFKKIVKTLNIPDSEIIKFIRK